MIRKIHTFILQYIPTSGDVLENTARFFFIFPSTDPQAYLHMNYRSGGSNSAGLAEKVSPALQQPKNKVDKKTENQ